MPRGYIAILVTIYSFPSRFEHALRICSHSNSSLISGRRIGPVKNLFADARGRKNSQSFASGLESDNVTYGKSVSLRTGASRGY